MLPAMLPAITPCLLALDTSTDLLTAALLAPSAGVRAAGRQDGVQSGLACVQETGGAQASTRLIPVLMGLLAEAGLALADVQAIGFGQGPGAFTGLRTACAVAQGLALAHETPLLAIDSLLIVAEDARAQAGSSAPGPDWWVAMDARMDEVYAAAYRHDAGGWQVVVAPQLWTLDALAAAWGLNPPQQVAGSALTAFADRLPWGTALQVPHCRDRAAALARLTLAAWQTGGGIAPDLALPLYLRDKVALTTQERLLRKAAAAMPAP